MIRATFRSLAARKLRLLLSSLSIVLGVSFVSGAFVLTDSLGKVFDDLFSTISQNVAVDIRGDEGHLRRPGRRPRSPAAGPRSAPSSRSTASRRPRARCRAAPSWSTPRARRSAPAAPRRSASTGTTASSCRAARSCRAGLRRGPDEIAINRGLLDRTDYKLGDSAPVLTDQPLKTYTIVGIVEFDGKPSFAGETDVFFDTADAQEVLEPQGQLQRDHRRRRRAASARPSCATGSAEVLPGERRGHHRRGGGRGAGERCQGGPRLLQHLPAGLRADRAVRRRLHHLQHVLDAGGAAHPRARPDADARRQPRPGPAGRAARGGRRRPAQLDHRAGCRCRRRARAQGAVRRLRGRSCPTAPPSSRPARSSRRSSSAPWSRPLQPSCRPGAPAGWRRWPRCATPRRPTGR